MTSKFKTASSLFSPLFQMNQLLSLQSWGVGGGGEEGECA